MDVQAIMDYSTLSYELDPQWHDLYIYFVVLQITFDELYVSLFNQSGTNFSFVAAPENLRIESFFKLLNRTQEH